MVGYRDDESGNQSERHAKTLVRLHVFTGALHDFFLDVFFLEKAQTSLKNEY
jgi:hypothetical protein